jgi:hypothetical protein
MTPSFVVSGADFDEVVGGWGLFHLAGHRFVEAGRRLRLVASDGYRREAIFVPSAVLHIAPHEMSREDAAVLDFRDGWDLVRRTDESPDSRFPPWETTLVRVHA